MFISYFHVYRPLTPDYELTDDMRTVTVQDSNNVSLVGTSPQLFDVCQVSTGNPNYRNKELFINELKRKCKYPIEFQKKNLEAYVAIEYKTAQRGYIVKKSGYLRQ